MSALSLPTDPSFLPGPWTSFTPTLTASVSNPTLGAGAVVYGRYMHLGSLVVCSMGITWGAAGLAVGSGTYRLSIPVNAPGSGAWCGTAFMYDSSAPLGRVAIVEMAAATYVDFWVDSATDRVTHASPWTWASNDQIQVGITYEAA